jgi:hypothetical protein
MFHVFGAEARAERTTIETDSAEAGRAMITQAKVADPNTGVLQMDVPGGISSQSGKLFLRSKIDK